MRAVRWPKLCWRPEEGYQFRSLTSSSLWRGASLTRAGRKFAARLTYFASFVRSPCHLRSRPTREPCTLPSDTGIQSLTHSSSRLRSMLAPAHFTRRTCEMARRSTGLQFAIHFRGSNTDHADPHKNAPNDTFSSRLLQRHFATKMFLRADLHDWFYAARNFAMVDDYSYPAVPRSEEHT